MEVEVILNEKNLMELRVDNITIAEVLRVYLNEKVDGVKFAAWRKDHPTKPVIIRIECLGKTVKKAVSEAISAIKKDSEKIEFLVNKK